MATLLHNGIVLDRDGGTHDCVLIAGGRIAAVGAAAVDAHSAALGARRVDLDGSVITAAFVDAHVHLTATGLQQGGTDLTGVRSAAELLRRVRDAAQRLPAGAVLIGHGWDDSAFTESGLPCADDVEAAAGRHSYLTRVDVHSALVSRSLMDSLPQLPGTEGYRHDGFLTRAAHGVVRQAVFAGLGDAQREGLQAAALRHFARLGVVSVHENAGPVVSGEVDLRSALSLGRRPDMPEVVGYWGELHAAARAVALGAVGAGGDLFVDGSLGSRTAHLTSDYCDTAGVGARYVSTEDLTEHFGQCLELGIQAGVHAIGDAAVADVVQAIAAADRRWRDATPGPDRGQPHAARPWRIEHCEMVGPDVLAQMAALGVVASVQPMFDALWGGAGGMYEQRLGAVRAAQMNPFASMRQAGIHLAFGSDSPVTEPGPWAAVVAAMNHHQRSQRITAMAAMAAHTHDAAAAAQMHDVEGAASAGARHGDGGFNGARGDFSGEGLTPRVPADARPSVRACVRAGAPADLAVWPRPSGLQADVDAEQVVAALALAGAQSLLTMRAGVTVHDAGVL
ncbi:MAG: amidohydrolase family protein [Actinomycetales bacterium]|nr:amidohydrolase family protein [Actinomycetales bacterium]